MRLPTSPPMDRSPSAHPATADPATAHPATDLESKGERLPEEASEDRGAVAPQIPSASSSANDRRSPLVPEASAQEHAADGGAHSQIRDSLPADSPHVLTRDGSSHIGLKSRAAGSSHPAGSGDSSSNLDVNSPSSSAFARSARPITGDRTVISKKTPPPAPVPLSPKASLEAGKLLEGESLGHFRLEEYIGGGGMGSVYRAIDTSLGRTVAVKVVSREHTDEDTLRRFRNEAQSAARLDHPNIARVYFVGEDKGWSYIVFEYIEGVNIRDLVEHKGFLPLEEALSYTLDIAQALEHATRRDVVHRDIKPSNILVTSDGRAKLVDMGLARLHQVEAPSNDLTATGVTLGTFDYISPEQARDPRSADVRSDLYSLGCTLYFMLTGTAPFPDGTVLQKLLSHSSDPPPDPRLVRPELPDEISPLLSKLLAKHPGQRYQTPYELMAAVLVISKQHGLTLTPRAVPLVITSAPSVSPWAATHLPWLVPLGVFAALVFVLHFFAPPSPQIDRQLTRPRWSPQAASIGTVDRNPDPARAVESSSGSQPTTESAPATKETTPRKTGSTEPMPQPGRDSGAQPALAMAASPAANAGKTESPSNPGESEPAPPAAATEPAGEPSAASQEGGPTTPHVATNGNAASGKPSSPGNTEGTGRVREGTSQEGPPAPKTIRKLIVDPQGGEAPDETTVVNSLSAASREAANLPDLEVIELRCGEVRDEPIVLTPKRPLQIRAAEGFSPVLSFEAQVTSTAPTRTMLHIVGGQVSFEGVSFRLVFPYGSSEGWSLFYLNRVEQFSLRRCAMTIENPDQRHRVAFMSLEGKNLAAMMMPNQPQASAVTTRIDLDRCIARGQATFLSCEEGLPFWLSWRQGFLATTERFLETGGTADVRLTDPIRVELQHVLARVDRGLCGVQMEEGAPYQLEMNFDLRNSVVLHDESVPLVEHLGVESSDKAIAKFGIRGEDNFYPHTKVRWRIQPKSTGAVEFSWDNRENQSWYKERLASQNVSWKRAPPEDRNVQRHLPTDYALSNLIGELAGCDPAELPELPK